MEKLLIEKEKNTPNIVFDPESNCFEISGRSFPENSKKFYATVLEWLDDYTPAEGQLMDFTFQFYYISSSSIISILELIKRLSKIKEKGGQMTITWKYDDDDDDIRKIGEDYAKLTSIPFTLEANAT